MLRMEITPFSEAQYPVTPELLSHHQGFDEPQVLVDPNSFHFWSAYTQETVGALRLIQIDRRLRLRKVEEAFAAQIISVPPWVRAEVEKLDEEALHTSSQFFLLANGYAPLLFARETRRDPWHRVLDFILGVDL